MRIATALLIALVSLPTTGCGSSGGAPDGDLTFDYQVPLDPASPWPKFRRDARQTGATPVIPKDDGAPLWTFRTGKGIFSSPVIGADGTVYIGSADRSFYAIGPDGTERWRFVTGEIIDSAALLDDRGRVYFGSGDGFLYALDARTGAEQWRFAAHPPEEVGAVINWFEGNVGIGPDGALIVPNDNFSLYAVERDSGRMRWRHELPDQQWSLPAVDPATGDLYLGNNNLLLPEFLGNVFAVGADGSERWRTGTGGTIAASALLLESGLLVLAGFDGYAYAFHTADGSEAWRFPTRDHDYASPALALDGSVIVASADGTVYSLDPSTGGLNWAFDWGAPIRSSPAVDGAGRIYVGSGDGHLVVLLPDGRLDWALRLIDEPRDDLNGSPAIGHCAIYLAGENGGVFGVPAGFCLRPAERENPACRFGPDEPLPDDDARVLFTTGFGAAAAVPPESIDPNQPLAFSLSLREGGDTRLALIDTGSLRVEVEPPVPLEVQLSADRRFLAIVPLGPFAAGDNGRLTLDVNGRMLVDPDRQGLKFDGGTDHGPFTGRFSFSLNPAGPAALPLPLPSRPGDPAGVWEWSRLAASLPTLLPSYNQIGFDSLHFLIGLVEGDGRRGVAWVVEGRPHPDGTRVDPDSGALFPFAWRYQDGLLSFENTDGMALEVMNTRLSFNTFRLAARLGPQGAAEGQASLIGLTRCGDIAVYGPFVRALGLCHPETDLLVAFGAISLAPWSRGPALPPDGIGTVRFSAEAGAVVARLDGSRLPAAAHNAAILLVDPADGRPVSLSYGLATARSAGPDGSLSAVSLSLDGRPVPDRVRAWLMLDTYPAAVAELDLSTGR